MELKKVYRKATGPRTLSIQTVTSCNLSCTICPHRLLYNGAPVMINEYIWKKSIQEAAEIDSLIYIYLTLHNEPFTDPHIFRRIYQVNELLTDKKDKWSALITNGKALFDKNIRHKLMIAKPGILFISLASGNPAEYEHITGLSFHTMVHTIKITAQLLDTVHVLVAKTKKTNTDYVKELLHKGPGCETIGLQFNPLVTIGGLVPECNTMRDWPFEHQLGKVCPHPSQFLTMQVDGSFIICCHDWKSQGRLGTIREHAIMDIYNGETLTSLRNEMEQGIYRYEMCGVCSKEFRYRQREECE